MPTRRLALLTAVIAAGALGAAGCSDPGPTTAPGPSTTAVDTSDAAGDTRLMAPGAAGDTVGRALAAAGTDPITVSAYLFVYPDGTARLCDGTIPGVPPKCTDPSMTVLDLPPEMVDQLPSQDGLKFSTGLVTLMGRMRDGVFHNDAELLARS